MKQVVQNYRSGELSVIDTPIPACKPGGVLVRSLYSLISTGTELMKVSEARLSLLGKAKARPDQVKKVLNTVAQQGPVATYQKVMNQLDSYTPLGYSLCGVVVEVGQGAGEFHVGQLVAAAGNEFALHAEFNWVPINLCVPVPDGVAPEHAAFSTVGAIAMQGVRRAEPQLGEAACVIGLGLIGQLIVRLLVASGVRVFGIDGVEERCRMAEKAGAITCAGPDPAGLAVVAQALGAATGGLGADHVFLAAGGSSNGPVEAAAELARDRARIVDIGKCSLDLPWNAYYEKELDVRFSRSYGPGRYDDTYELEGVDYPAGYVRWTERRNLGCFVDLIWREQLDVASLVSGVYPVEDAVSVYDKLNSGALSGVGFLFEYPGADEPLEERAPAAQRLVPSSGSAPRPAGDTLSIGFIGAGNYASSMLLPHLADKDGIRLARVATTTSLSAVNAQRRFHFEQASTAVDDILDDDSISTVFVVTRHQSHAQLVCRALERGKTVFVEKPLALNTDQLEQVVATVRETGNDRLMVGFNRRFAPMLGDLKTQFGPASGPSTVRYLVNAGPLGHGSWYLNEQLEGSRFVGEGGHFIDTLSWWIGARPVQVHAMAGADPHNLQISLRFEDGSIASLTYDTSGHPRVPKETFDVSAGGRSARMDNFRRATVWNGRRRHNERARSQDKGQAAQVAAFLMAVRTGGPMPISIDSLVATTAATIAVNTSIVNGLTEQI
jgi:predicted dehydrogenase/threonine dehydrogenase-like Zn-dependent dehydrogenase